MPDLSAYIGFTAEINLTDKNNPFIKITDTSAYPTGIGAGISGVVKVIQPDLGEYTGDWDNPDIVYAISPSVEIPIRLSSSNQVQGGTWVITYTADHASYTPTILTRTITLTYKPVEVKITNQFDVFDPSLTYQDDTVYDVTGYTKSVTRAWKATSTPTGLITGTAAWFDIILGGNYYDASYAVSLDSTVTYTSVTYPWLSIKDKISASETAHAYTPPPAATLLGYITTLKATMDGLKNTCQAYDDAKKDYQYAYNLYNHLMKRICQDDTVGVYTYVQEILDILHDNQSIPATHTNTIIPAYDYDCGDTPASTLLVEVIAGTAEAIAAGITVGSSTYVNDELEGAKVEVVRGNINLPGIVTTDGGDYFTKPLASNTITFSSPIQDGEYIKIKLLTGTVTSVQDDNVITVQQHLSGASVTVLNATDWFIVNPTATLASLNITLPAIPVNGQLVRFSSGGTLTSGTVVTALTVTPNAGHTILEATSPTAMEIGESFEYRFYNNVWYRVN